MMPQVGRWQAAASAMAGTALLLTRVALTVLPRRQTRNGLLLTRAIVLLAVVAAVAPLRVMPASSASSIVISEVAPWSSGNSSLGADWFEVTNTGTTAVDITGWRVDDSSPSFANSVALNGITSIGPGESVIFIESATPATAAAFRTLWFGTNPPAGLQIGTYSGSGVGLSTGGDEVNLFDASGVLQANVAFGSSPTGPTFATFNNAAGLTGTISTLSTVGVNAAFVAANDPNEIGSPGTTLSKIFISEVAPWSSGNSPLGADWFEVTNTTPNAVNITGWRMDDSSSSFASSVALNGITSIGPGESVIFIETADAATTTAFRTLWFGANPPAGLQVGTYSGSGVGLGTGGDEVNLFDASGVSQANVAFGASPSGPAFPTFENRAGLSGTITSLSALGTTGAVAANDPNEIGSPGTIGKPAQVVVTPLPPVKINEIESIGGSPSDWIEIINTGTVVADLSGLKLLDSDNTHTPYSIPAGTSLGAGAVLVLDQAQFGFELDNVDSVTLFGMDGTTVIDAYAWTQHAVTTFGRCPEVPSALTTTLTPSKGTPNVCLNSIAAEPWPGGSSVTIADDLNVFGQNLSGLAYQASGTTAPGILWAVSNGPGTLYRLTWDAANSRWTPDPSGWVAGKPLRYTDGSPDPDAEGVTFTDAGPAGGVYVSTERNNTNNTVSRPTILRFDVSGSGSTLTATQEWNLTADLPVLGANLGLEGLTWIPDSYLVARNFFDESKGRAYNPADYPTHGTGLFFVGIEANGLIYAYALNSNGSYTRVATIVTGFGGVMELHFDRDRGDFWALCDNTCEGRTELLTINQSTGRFGIAHLYERPSGMPNINNEGFATTPDFECVNGRKPAFWSDDGNDGGHALRAGTVPCNFSAPPTATSTPTQTPVPSLTSTPTPTSTPTQTPVPSFTSTPTGTPVTPAPTNTPAPAGAIELRLAAGLPNNRAFRYDPPGPGAVDVQTFNGEPGCGKFEASPSLMQVAGVSPNGQQRQVCLLAFRLGVDKGPNPGPLDNFRVNQGERVTFALGTATSIAGKKIRSAEIKVEGNAQTIVRITAYNGTANVGTQVIPLRSLSPQGGGPQRNNYAVNVDFGQAFTRLDVEAAGGSFSIVGGANNSGPTTFNLTD